MKNKPLTPNDRKLAFDNLHTQKFIQQYQNYKAGSDSVEEQQFDLNAINFSQLKRLYSLIDNKIFIKALIPELNECQIVENSAVQIGHISLLARLQKARNYLSNTQLNSQQYRTFVLKLIKLHRGTSGQQIREWV